jgi:hypothetical protein
MVAWRWRLMLALMACALALVWGGAAAPAPAVAARPASSYGAVVVMSPASSSGPVDALHSSEVRLYPADPVTYALSVTPTSPDQSGCASTQLLSGAPTFQVRGPADGTASFHWPAALGHGRYWLCAAPSAGTGPTADSPPLTPFTVLTDAAPAVDAVLAPAGGQACSGFTVTVTNWLTDERAPQRLMLLPDGGGDVGMPLDATLDASQTDPTSGTYAFSVAPPCVPQSGRYACAAQGDCQNAPCAISAHSAFFTLAVVSSSFHFAGASPPTRTAMLGTPTATATSVLAHGGPIGHPANTLLWGWVVAAVLVLALLALGLYAFRRMR